MGSTAYYWRLKSSGGTVVKDGMISAPTGNLYYYSGTRQYIYAFSLEGNTYHTVPASVPTSYSPSINLNDTVNVYGSSSSTMPFRRVTGNSSLSLTSSIPSGTTVKKESTDNSFVVEQYSVYTPTVYTVTVKKCLDNGTQTTVSTLNVDEGTSTTVQIPTAYDNSVLSSVLINSSSQTYQPNGYVVSPASNTTILFKFTSTVKISLAKGAGGGSLSGSATTSFTNVSTSANAGGSFRVEKDTMISLSATSADGYVLSTNAITSSSSDYESTSGNGSTSKTTTKKATVATTFTVNGSQFKITPSIVSHSDWGTATINGSSGSVVLKPNTTYALGFTSSTTDTLAAVVDYWSIGGSNYSTTFTTGDTVTSDIAAYLHLNRTKWQLTVSNGTSDEWGRVYLGSSGTNTSGWFANGTSVPIRFVSSMESTYAPRIWKTTYNNVTSDVHSGSTSVTTVDSDGNVLVQLEKTKFLMSVAYGNTGTEGWGTIGNGGIYVGTGDTVTLRFTPDSSLISTIHPQVDNWTFLQQTSAPTPSADGSSCVSVELGTVTSDFTAYCYLASSWRKVTIIRSDANADAWGDFYLGAIGTETTAYYEPGTQITMRFVRDVSYDTNERPQVNSLVIGTESTVVGIDGTYEYSYTLPANVKTDLVIYGSVKQTAWPVSVSSAGNGSVTASRVDIATSAVIGTVTTSGAAATIYLRSGTTAEYISMTASPSSHYGFASWTKSNLSNYGGNASNVQLTTAASASVSGAFERNDFKVSVTSDIASVCDVYMQDSATNEAYYQKSQTANPVVVCKIKSAYSDEYKVTTFTIGGQAGVVAQYNSAADLYYVEVSNRNDVVVTAHVVATKFDLAINVGPSNKAQFGRVIVSANGQEIKDVSTENFSGKVREGTRISVVFYQKYGGKVIEIQPSAQITNPVITDYGIEFDMPSASCSVEITLGAKTTYQLTVGIRNLAEGQSANIPGIVTVRSRTYPDTIIGATTSDGTDNTFAVYKDEEYSLVVTPVSDYLSKRYAFIGWRDASGAISGATETTLNIINSDVSVNAISRFAGYNARGNGTITIEWAKKENETITTLSEAPSGCSLTILNETDKYDETHWLVGNDIDIPYEARGSAYDQDGNAYKWTPIQVDVAVGDDPYATPNAAWDDGLLTQDGSFRMLGNMKVRVVLTQTVVQGFTTMHVGYKQSTALMGEVSIFSTEMDAYTQDSTGATVLAQKQKKAVIMASPRPGFAFAGWFTLAEGVWTAVAGAKAVYEIETVTSPMTVYYAQFVASTVSNVKMWNGNESVAKTCEWQSKVYVGSQFFQLSACRVYADAYPLTMKIMMASSPDGVFGERARTIQITISNQNPRRLPMVRPEKYLAFKVTGYSRINHVGLASSMEALK